ATSAIDSLSFGSNSTTITVNYDGTTVYVVNPLAFEGVSITVDGADVTVKSTIDEKGINYCLTGTTSNGSFKLYSEKSSNLLLNGVNITNDNGPAINIQSGKAIYTTLVDGTVNSLADGIAYATAQLNSDGSYEDQKATFFSEGQLIFNGTGSLTIAGKGSDAHGLCSDDFIQVDNGSLTVSSAVKDGIHGKDGVYIKGGTVKVTATGDGIDGDEGVANISGGSVTVICASADVKGIASDSTIAVSGGTVNVTMNGAQSKGLKSKQAMTLSGGDITVKTTGAAVLTASGSGYDPSYCVAVKSDEAVNLNGSNVTVNCSGAGGKGISSETAVNMTSGTVNITTIGNGATYTNATGTADAYRATCISSDNAINILGGTLTVSSSGTAGEGISSDNTLTIGDASNSPIVNVTTSGTKLTISSSSSQGGTGGGPGGGGGQSTGDYAEPKAIKATGAVTINNGTTTISSADDGIKSTTSITINSGTVNIVKSVEGMEGPALTVNNGTVSIVSSDDCFNATKGNGGESNDGSCLYFYGGNVSTSSTAGDAIDSNGNIVMTGGTVVAQGPASSPEVGIDVNGTFNISGGVLIATGPSAQNMEATSTTSSQYTALITSTSSIGTNLLHLQDASGNELFTFKPVRSSYYVVFSSPSLKSGSSYTLYTGGSTTGTSMNGLYKGGVYTPGTVKKTFTISSKVTSVSF
ncbi:MAG: carbohydrate-binding domain-containing protein, partial [Bacteroidota bacterium]|nr:carbohydrate-binding domain-containing protein [Bacteroidota bacterium]